MSSHFSSVFPDICLINLCVYVCCSVVSDSLRPHGPQTARPLCPWDFPGKNTGVGCHFFLQCRKVKSESEVAQSCPTLRDPMDCSPPGSSVHGILQARVLEWGAIAFSKSTLQQNSFECCHHQLFTISFQFFLKSTPFQLCPHPALPPHVPSAFYTINPVVSSQASLFFWLIFIYLAAPGLSCDMWDLQLWQENSQLQPVGSSSLTRD